MNGTYIHVHMQKDRPLGHVAHRNTCGSPHERRSARSHIDVYIMIDAATMVATERTHAGKRYFRLNRDV